ncbi:hypothetical protein [Fulvivirga sediminis]|uniref:Uncharacterized protein n=1 Tax=Fulvivirga sediminis TaxID=2803949 RepID=A0A937FDL6_9BACT|nr:hypothetical protein [Fulvivirga sediminis]MBL3658473.1 hypothetical protein [Fulvivirga sediminis]
MNNSDYKLKLYSKKLKSGKCQIKFVVSSSNQSRWHGYMLAESGSTLKEVVSSIEEEMRYIDAKDAYYHSHLYNLAEPLKRNRDSILIFNS